ncbi:MAG TPA: alpha/beta family hydrolase [Steroidobacteraceae bacterium]|nr:alpha/beta family hydrolase [Steroidobacteraceae bacterium]
MTSVPERVTIAVSETTSVSGLMQCPPQFNAGLVLAHGAGAGMEHPFMVGAAEELAALRIATLRFQFPYMENHRNRPDPPALCHATVRAAVAAARDQWPSVPLFAGGKSFGGRMTSQAQAAAALPSVRGIVFLGFPLHPPKQPSDARAQHLSKIEIPLLFLQGTRDAFAEMALLQPLVGRLGPIATLSLLQDADHSFHVPARAPRNNAQVQSEMLNALATWIGSIIEGA